MAVTRLKIKLLQMGLRQNALAARAGLDASTISMICRAYLNPTPERRKKIAEALQISEFEIFG